MVVKGLNGDLRGTCIVCLTPTDTGFAVIGEAEALIAALRILGLEADDANRTAWELWREHDPTLPEGRAPVGRETYLLQICRRCAARRVRVGLLAEDQPIPSW